MVKQSLAVPSSLPPDIQPEIHGAGSSTPVSPQKLDLFTSGLGSSILSDSLTGPGTAVSVESFPQPAIGFARTRKRRGLRTRSVCVRAARWSRLQTTRLESS